LNELLEKLQQAEAEAAKIREDAAEQARGLVKDAEESGASSARQSQKAAREEAARLVEEAAVCTRDEINQLSVRRSAERELMRGLARTRIAKTTATLVERIIGHGDC